MKKILLTLLAAFLLIGCSSSDATTNEKLTPKIVLSQALDTGKLKDQNGNIHTLPADTKTVIFAFSKDGAHTCNDYFATKNPEYLAQNKTVFIADVSAAPSLIRSMFIMPGLKDFKHTVLLLDDEQQAAPFRKDMDTEKIVVVNLDNGTISKINTITTQDELIKAVEK
jgi:uncharacterized protein YxeA